MAGGTRHAEQQHEQQDSAGDQDDVLPGDGQ